MSDRDSWTQWIKTHDTLAVPVRVPRKQKYHALPTVVDDIAFDSQREADRFQELKLLLAAGLISHLEVHPGWPLQVVELYRDGPPWVVDTIGMYHADFKYLDLRSGEWTIEDIKCTATKTTAYQLRKKIAEAVHGITITEVE